jgi:hypothetical protein
VRGGVVFIDQKVKLEELKKPAPPASAPTPPSRGVVPNGALVLLKKMKERLVLLKTMKDRR